MLRAILQANIKSFVKYQDPCPDSHLSHMEVMRLILEICRYYLETVLQNSNIKDNKMGSWLNPGWPPRRGAVNEL